MLNKKIEKAINEQINAELYSSYLYLSMAAYFESVNLKGMASWMRVQATEENGHAMKFFDYIAERGGRITLEEIDAPPSQWSSSLAVFQETYKHEQKVTSLINKLAELAASEKDHASSVMLQWFISEQVEEEANALEIVEKLKMVKDSNGGLLMLDHHLGKRGSSGE